MVLALEPDCPNSGFIGAWQVLALLNLVSAVKGIIAALPPERRKERMCGTRSTVPGAGHTLGKC